MLVHFSKYQGTGNDFVMVDGRSQDVSSFDTRLIQRLCDRRFGVGGDGLIILEESAKYDFIMRYFNADGTVGTMCGNGGRCIAAFAQQLGIIKGRTTFEGIDGAHSASMLSSGDIRLKLVDVSEIERLEDGYLLHTGSPHFVKLVNHLEEVDVEREGREIGHQGRFGEGGANVNFMEADSASGKIAVRTFERGVEAETWSCGTGVTAAAISAVVHFKADTLSYQIKTRGGTLQVDFETQDQKHFTQIYLTGPASHVYDGTLEIIV
jgi:diaminopimelate epimerase